MPAHSIIEDDELRELGEKILLDNNIDISSAKVGYVIVYPYISKTTISKCIKTNKELNYFSKYDYIIEVSGEIWDALANEDELKYIILHYELTHILITNNEKTGELDLGIRKYDIEGYSSIFNKYGTEWVNKLKLSVSSLYDLSPKSYDSIKI